MLKNEEYDVGDVVEVKKKHPCGSKQWQILRVGMDIKLQCCGCSRTLMMPRTKFNRMGQKVIGKRTKT